ncbi:MAG: hypothetical protein U9R79_13985 [Armatimonadota bacterium]|nr:hypothetical protein [Armatimonadota bacterium]
MYAVIYFDTEDYFSPPDSPVHRLPGQMAEIMTKHGLPGCFHIHGEKARFMERHGQRDVIEAIGKHDVSLHFDRGSVHPTTAEEVSGLGWFEGVARVLFREVPGFQALERIFGKCSAITRHGGTLAAQIIYACGMLGKPYFHTPFRLPGRNVAWYCNALTIGGYQAGWHFDTLYRDTPAFERQLARVDGYLAERAESYDYTAMFGCHPVITVMRQFPDALNFKHGAAPPPSQWQAPEMVEGVSIETILRNFERLVVKLVNQPNVEWTTVAGIHDLYGRRAVRVSDSVLLRGAEAALEAGGATFTDELTAAELLFLLAARALERADTYEVPQVMGPLEEPSAAVAMAPTKLPIEPVAEEIVDTCRGGGYLPAQLSLGNACIRPEQALVLLAAHAMERTPPRVQQQRPYAETIPGVADALEIVRGCKRWRPHGPQFNLRGITEPFVRQCWTVKPAFTEDEYGPGVELGRHVNPMFDRPT